MMITFPSVKDQAAQAATDHTSCQVRACVRRSRQILVMCEYKWFELWREEPCGQRAEEYAALKDSFRARAFKTLFRFYPQVSHSRLLIALVTSP